ncbi:vascular cell adhesion protein 1-like isoform X2 [Garra rufa]|uniref:vascular cell adhesion protein 1-like isoform X2 n=1 Tax=Garra rufa TaxID=137080 RepID=UPI003CCE5D19
MQKGSFSHTTPDWRLLGFCFLYFSLVAGTQAECPVQFSQKSVVVEYGGSVAVNCSASVPHYGMGWEASEGGVDKIKGVSVITWSVSDLTQWDIKPLCFINYDKSQDKPCGVNLPVTIYKTPDNVSISIVNHSGPMIEGNQYQLQCDVKDVAPVQYLTVKWYKGQTLNETLLNQTTFKDTSITPVNETATLLIRPDRADDGAQYRCAAELDLGAEGPQPPPNKTSEPLNISVHFKPIINKTKLQSIVPVFQGYPVKLVCKAEGNPIPKISWSLGGNKTEYGETLNVSTPQNVSCNASNSAGWDSVEVSIQEDYIPIIVGIIVAVVVVISVIFIYIYLTYYKKNRMGHYDVKNPNARNELLAQSEQSL